MQLLQTIDLPAVRELYRSDLPTPVDVLNLIHFKDQDAYRWYGVMVAPLLKLVGGQLGWIGTHVRSFVGEPRAEDLAVVRYPNQRRFFALALNPYYVAIANPQRLKAVRRFEASFTHSPDSLRPLRQSQWLVVVHLHDGLGAARNVVEASGGQRVYQSRETAEIRIANRAHPAGTNPLAFKQTVMFRFATQEDGENAMTPRVLDEVREAVGEVSVQLYRRLSRDEALPALLARLLNSP